jgi:hypothetical protein
VRRDLAARKALDQVGQRGARLAHSVSVMTGVVISQLPRRPAARQAQQHLAGLTCWPSATSTSATVASARGDRLCSSFIDSITTAASPAIKAWPTCAATRTTLPFNGLSIP